jgi:pilus retraction protein PilT
MAGMDIAEKRKPQDGRAQVTHSGQKIDLRISSLPTIQGEKIVIRVLDSGANQLRLEDMGFTGENLARYRTMYKASYGLVLITGPTGSGKTTTLYATLQELNQPERNLITVEDPVEYRMEGVNQVAVNTKIGMTFANGLRAILRQDPDVVVVGELRDLETISIAVTAAETGHLVLATLHTRSAVETVDRIIDVFPEQQQRQIRVQLAGCLQAVASQQLLPDKQGGRRAVFEIMIVTPALRNLIREGKTQQMGSYIQTGGQYGMQTMDAAVEELKRSGSI